MLEKFGVAPDKVIEVQALAGDSVDNVPGVPGIGIKTAAQLIEEYGDLENLLAHAEEIKQPKRRENLIEHAEMPRISRTLGHAGQTRAGRGRARGSRHRRDPEPDVAARLPARQEFRTTTARVETWFGRQARRRRRPHRPGRRRRRPTCRRPRPRP